MSGMGLILRLPPGRGYEMVTLRDTFVVLVGSNDPDGLVQLNENPRMTNESRIRSLIPVSRSLSPICL